MIEFPSDTYRERYPIGLVDCDICGKKMAADRDIIPGCCVSCEEEGNAQLGFPPEKAVKKRKAGRLHPNWIVSVKRQVSSEDQGFVYVLSNPAWPDCVKIGKTHNVQQRLGYYNTSCPHRDFKLEHAEQCLDRHYAEYRVHKALDKYKIEGEWFKLSSEKAVKLVCHALGK